MGRMAMFAVMALGATLGIVGYNLNNSKNMLTHNVIGFSKYTIARDVAHTSVNMYLRYLDKYDSVPPSPYGTNVLGGSCEIYHHRWQDAVTKLWYLNIDTCNVTYLDTNYTMRIYLSQSPTPFPGIDGAVGLHVPDVNFNINGASGRIDGHDHDIDGNLLPPSANDKPGVAVLAPQDTADVLNPAWAGQIDGTKKCVCDSGMADPSLYVDQYIAARDYYFTTVGSPYASNMQLGSAANPVIVYCEGNVKFAGSVEGWGLLVVHGNLTLAGTFAFHGLVIAYKEASLIEEAALSTGTPDIYGAFLMAGGTGSSFTMKGNVKVLYSSEAIKNAMGIAKLQAYRVISWYE